MRTETMTREERLSIYGCTTACELYRESHDDTCEPRIPWTEAQREADRAERKQVLEDFRASKREYRRPQDGKRRSK